MEQVEINGLLWDTENLEVDGKKYFTWKEAMEISEKMGKRLPTKEEWEALIKSGSFKTVGEKGIYFYYSKLFLPAKGRQTPYGEITNNSFPYYWTSTFSIHPYTKRAFYFFGGDAISVYPDFDFYELPIRCVQDNKSSCEEKEKFNKEYFIKHSYIAGFMDGCNAVIFGSITRSEALKYANDGAESFLNCQWQ